ncbi:WD40-repeat-containing domain protein [Phaeosphaeria sp. MPI-PUGE-AT-0046c]|nr:WD40-repeat-containing domain protein [Phaeosphaeria sp. MPI-PUGE-AT-0046c]
MADILPRIKVTDPLRTGTSQEGQENAVPSIGEGPLSSKKLAAKLRSPTSPSAISNDTTNRASTEGRRPSEAAIDPLSQRTNTSPAIQKLRSQPTDPAPGQAPTSPNEANVDKKPSAESPRDGSGAYKADKKKVSFLSRFIGGNKKKGGPETASDDGTEADDSRPEGMDAQLYVENLSFSPKIPQPPTYIKVRTKFKKTKEFDRVFLAQELRSGSHKRSAPAAGSNPAPQSGSAASHNPVWAVEFSRDGKYLATGGQDRVVRVWSVISNSGERQPYEHYENDAHNNGSEASMNHLSAPVFRQEVHREYHGHTATILDLSWSKNNFLLSSSMDKTVRLWHVSRNENLCVFKHSDFVPSIQFHPTDDRFFLAGSLDAKLRLWSIPDKNVAFSVSVPDMITAVSFTPDGKTCIAGTLSGLCMFYDTEKLKWQAQMHVKSTRGQNAKGSKITGIQATYWPPGSESGEIKLLISSNDSRLRLYNFKDKSLEMKFRGHENNCSQIRGGFADSSGHVICGSEDRKAYIWSTTAPEGEKRNQRPVEIFEAHNSITTCTVIAPMQTRRLLSASEDPIYDLCNPPPVTLVSKADSIVSSRAPDDSGPTPPTPAFSEANFKRVAEKPAYVARSAHRGGNIIVTADYTGAIKVFRQDCAYSKRVRMSETWDTGSLRKAGSRLGRPSSILSRTSHSRRSSVSTQPPNDRIMTWRQGISHGSFDSNSSLPRRSNSPRKSLARMSLNSVRYPDSPSLRPTLNDDSLATGPSGTPKTSISMERTTSQSASQSEILSPPLMLAPERTHSSGYQQLAPPENPLAVYNGQSWGFWNMREHFQNNKNSQNDRPNLDPRVSQVSQVSKLTDELALSDGGHNEDDAASRGDRSEVVCKQCGGGEFKVRFVGGEKVLACGKCGTVVDEEVEDRKDREKEKKEEVVDRNAYRRFYT